MDSEKLANECNDKINGIKAKEKERKRRNRNITLGSIATAIIVITVILLTTLVFVPLGRQNNIKTLITEGKYEEAQNLIDENGSFGETKKLEVMCDAGEAFEDLDYEKGIKEICSIGGSVTIYYDSNGTTIDKESEVITSFDSMNNSIYKEGYKDYNWVLTNYSTNASDYTAIIYLKAEYLEAIKYSIDYELNGGVFKSGWKHWYTVESEDKPIPNPTKKGYTFLGWTSRTITTPTKDLVIESGSTGNIFLTANWQVNEYTMYLDENNGNDPAVRSVTYNCSYSLPTLATKVGYDAYWYDESNDKYYSGSITYNQDSNLYLKPKYVLHDYEIIYNLDGGVNNENNPLTYTLEDDNITLQDPTRSGSVFLGWTNENITTPTKSISIKKGTIGDLNYTANWKVYYTYTDSTKTSLYFGSYPQTEVSSMDGALLSTLNTKAGHLPTATNIYNWIDYGYYVSGSVSSNMYYIDIDNDSDGTYDYRGVYFRQSRPYYTTTTSSNTNQPDNGYNTTFIYWFKYEPIKWNVLTAKNGKILLISDLLLDSQDYYYSDSSRSGATDYQGNTKTGTTYANNYMFSHIRSWLNETFYETAFSTLEKEIIETTTVDNSVSSTGNSSNSYACGNTSDKMFLLSCKEVTTYYPSNSKRQAKGSDYAKSQGLYVSSDSSYSGYSWYWLRSPVYSCDYFARYIHYDGDICNDFVFYTYYGVRPACWINKIN